jgi:hypothetical protein
MRCRLHTRNDPTSHWQATANASAITHNALQAQYQKRSHKSMAGNCLRIRYYTQCDTGSIPETIPQNDGNCKHTGFYTQCVSCPENQHHIKSKKCQMQSFRLNTERTAWLNKPNEGIHICLYTVMKNARPRLPMYSGRWV